MTATTIDPTLSRAFLNQKLKRPHSPEEAAALRKYRKVRHALRNEMYWADEEEKRDMRERSRAEGYKEFARWVRDMVCRGINASTRTEDEWRLMDGRLLDLQARIEHQAQQTCTRDFRKISSDVK